MDLSIATGDSTQLPSNKICFHDASSTTREAASEPDLAQEKVATMLYVTYHRRIRRSRRLAPWASFHSVLRTAFACILIASPPALNGLFSVLKYWGSQARSRWPQIGIVRYQALDDAGTRLPVSHFPVLRLTKLHSTWPDKRMVLVEAMHFAVSSQA